MPAVYFMFHWMAFFTRPSPWRKLAWPSLQQAVV